ncbi:hypothetical protein EJB05_12337, partial [Eragrostis curvula]
MHRTSPLCPQRPLCLLRPSRRSLGFISQPGGQIGAAAEACAKAEEEGAVRRALLHLFRDHVMSGGQEVEGQEAGGQVLDGQGNKDKDESASLVSAAKQKRPLATNPQKHPAAKKVKSPSAGSKPPLASKSPSMRPPSMKQPRHMAKKQSKSSAAKQLRSPMVRTRSPVITGSPMMRFLVSSMMMRARTPPSRSPKARTQRSLSKSPAPQSPSNDH